MQKLILLLLICSIGLQASAEQNESKIFLDKYSTDVEKVKKEIDIDYNADISASKLFKDINISDSIKADAKEIVKNRFTDEKIKNDAEDDAQVIYTDKFKKQFREAKDNLLYDKELNWSAQAAAAKEHIESNQATGQDNFYFNSKETIYIFISSSMPKATIKNYLESTKHIQNNVVFILQGAIGGMQKIKPTLIWIKDLIGKEYANAKIIIEPRISKKFDIERVPAILYTQHDILDVKSDIGDTFIFYGDMPISYALKKMLEKKQNDFLASIVKKLETR